MTLKEKSYKIFLFSDQYKQMVMNALEMAIIGKNPSAIISNTYITEQAFDTKTKYCDYRIIYPLLFLFYHWMELVLKGFLLVLARENPETKKPDIKKIAHHNLIKLLKNLKKITLTKKILLISLRNILKKIICHLF